MILDVKLTKPKLIQLIHIAKSKLNMDELSYRVLLDNLTGKTSTTKMTIEELLKVYESMKDKGFKPQVRKGRTPVTEHAIVKSRITHKIRAIWIQMHKAGIVKDGSERALNRFMHNTLFKAKNNQPNQLIKLNVQSLDDDEATNYLRF
ncbi:Mu-like prophage protein gp16 [Aggregatibacter aphrophilus ATCC 33389]|uniref:Mu-like prophage protein gp16 n=1 Tax=Aggregatibacter aphrophilus ATCC 33389 TaxID=985008 RepID=A0A448F5R4_AGGAP|nr:Mu-like prophage protein gp16 [Aggregatibacter aphrophilus ATCC 33389]